MRSTLASAPAHHAALRVAGPAAWTLTMAMLVVASLLGAEAGFAEIPGAYMTGWSFAAQVLLVVTQSTCGLVLVARRPGNVIGPLVGAYAAVAATSLLAWAYVGYAESGHGAPLDPAWVAAVVPSTAFVLNWLIAVTIAFLFPDGTLVSPGWRYAIIASAAGAAAMLAGMLLTPDELLLTPGVENPVTDPPAGSLWVVLRDVVGPSVLAAGAVASVVALVCRYRRSDEVVHLQIRWYVTSALVFAACAITLIASLTVLDVPTDSRFGQTLVVVTYLAGCLPPVAIVIAILRYRLYEIDEIIGHTVVYGALTAILAGVYTASIRLFNALFVAISGEESEVALVLTTLILATTFTPIKQRLERLVDRHARHAPPAHATPSRSLLDDPELARLIDERARAILDETRSSAGHAPPGERP